MPILEKTLRSIAIGGIFTLPFVCLFVSGTLFFPYITGKNFAFRIIVEIIAGAWLALALVNPAYRPRRSWVLGALAFFVVSIGVSDVFGAYSFKSIWSNYERMDGWMTLAHLLVYTLAAASLLNTEKLWRRLLWTTLGVSAYLSFYGLFQVAGKVALGLGGTSGLTGRIDGTFGNPIYFAVYMLFHVFFAGMLWAQQWVEKGPGRRFYISAAYASIIVLDIAALFLTGTRGSMLGLVGGVMLASLCLLFLARNSRNVWRAAAVIMAGMLLLIGAFFAVKDEPWVQRVGFLQRLASISLKDQTTESRFVNWSMAWKGVQERPILGWGQENYALVFDKYYDPRMYKQEPWFDRVHNIIFDWLVAGGFVGLFAYLSVFAAALFALWRRTSQSDGDSRRHGGFSIAEKSILTGLLAGYFCHNFFVFDNVTSYILFGTVLAFIAYRSSSGAQAPRVFEHSMRAPKSLPYAAIACTALVLFVAWSVNHQPLLANRALLSAIANPANPTLALAHFKEAASYNTMGLQEVREQIVQAAVAASRSQVSDDTKREFFAFAESEMRKQVEESPLDARFPLFLGILYEAYGLSDQAKLAYEHALSLSTKKQNIMYQLAQNAIQRGDVQGAIRHLDAAYALDTNNQEAAVVYAATLIRVGKTADAERLLAPFVERGYAADPRILAAYKETKQIGRAIPLWEALVRVNPGEPQSYFTLAAIHYLAGNSAAAIAILEDVKLAVPKTAGDADTVIQQIRTGSAVVQ